MSDVFGEENGERTIPLTTLREVVEALRAARKSMDEADLMDELHNGCARHEDAIKSVDQALAKIDDGGEL